MTATRREAMARSRVTARDIAGTGSGFPWNIEKLCVTAFFIFGILDIMIFLKPSELKGRDRDAA